MQEMEMAGTRDAGSKGVAALAKCTGTFGISVETGMDPGVTPAMEMEI